MARQVCGHLFFSRFADLTCHSAAAVNEATSERERKELNERFEQLRPEVLETLRELGG